MGFAQLLRYWFQTALRKCSPNTRQTPLYRLAVQGRANDGDFAVTKINQMLRHHPPAKIMVNHNRVAGIAVQIAVYRHNRNAARPQRCEMGSARFDAGRDNPAHAARQEHRHITRLMRGAFGGAANERLIAQIEQGLLQRLGQNAKELNINRWQ